MSPNSFYAHLFVAFARIMRRFMASNIQKTDVIRQKAAYNIRFYAIKWRLMYLRRRCQPTGSIIANLMGVVKRLSIENVGFWGLFMLDFLSDYCETENSSQRAKRGRFEGRLRIPDYFGLIAVNVPAPSFFLNQIKVYRFNSVNFRIY
jgi:hypothetical protein